MAVIVGTSPHAATSLAMTDNASELNVSLTPIEAASKRRSSSNSWVGSSSGRYRRGCKMLAKELPSHDKASDSVL
jgi:hypothetical protein